MITYVLVMAIMTGAGGVSTEKLSFTGMNESSLAQKCEDVGKQFTGIKADSGFGSPSVYTTYKCIRIDGGNNK